PRGWLEQCRLLASWIALSFVLRCFGWLVDARLHVRRTAAPARRALLSRSTLRAAVVVAVSVAIAVLVTIVYVGVERTIYVFDSCIYWDQTRWVVRTIDNGPRFVLDHLDRSLKHDNYNALA